MKTLMAAEAECGFGQLRGLVRVDPLAVAAYAAAA